MTHVIGRVSNRAMVGAPLCRDHGYIDSVVKFAETIVPYAMLLNWIPEVLKPIVYWILSTSFGGPKEPMRYLVPYVQKCLSDHEKGEKFSENLTSSFLINAAPADEAQSPEKLSMRILNLNFGSIHTTSIFVSYALFKIAGISNSEIKEMRNEITSALRSEGEWNKNSLAKLRRIDSLLREVGRLSGLGQVGMIRAIVKDTTLDGVHVPAGYSVGLYMKGVQRNPDLDSDPNAFQPFRFLKMREEEGSDVKYGFTTIGNNFLLFGAGRHAGRFFAAMELKIILAYILLKFQLRCLLRRWANGKTTKYCDWHDDHAKHYRTSNFYEAKR